jgi:hypothetical protein
MVGYASISCGVVLVLAVSTSARDSTGTEFRGVRIGITADELLKVRPGVTTARGLDDKPGPPFDPKRPNQVALDPPKDDEFFQLGGYAVEGGRVVGMVFHGTVAAKDFATTRRRFLAVLLRLWGRPDRLEVLNLGGRSGALVPSPGMVWQRGDAVVEAAVSPLAAADPGTLQVSIYAREQIAKTFGADRIISRAQVTEQERKALLRELEALIAAVLSPGEHVAP